MLSQERCAILLQWQAPAPNPARFHAGYPAQLQAYPGPAGILRCGLGGRRGEDRSSARLPELALGSIDLDERIIGVHGLYGRIEHGKSAGIIVFGRQARLYGGPQPAESAKRVVDGRGLVAAVNHTVGTLRITRFRAIVLPFGGIQQLLEGVRVAVLEQIARLLPAENVVRRHAPGCAGISPLAHEEFEEER